MLWFFSFYKLTHPGPRYIWCQVQILHETDKAILVYNGGKFWVPKSRIRNVRLRRGCFELFLQEGEPG